MANRILCAVQNQFDSLDLSDNAIGMLEGFPKLSRLKTLLINNNRISRISRNLEGERMPHGTTLQIIHSLRGAHVQLVYSLCSP